MNKRFPRSHPEEFARNFAEIHPPFTRQEALVEAARRHELLVGKGGTFGNCIRITPPLNISKTDVDEFARVLDLSLAECMASVAGARA